MTESGSIPGLACALVRFLKNGSTIITITPAPPFVGSTRKGFPWGKVRPGGCLWCEHAQGKHRGEEIVF